MHPYHSGYSTYSATSNTPARQTNARVSSSLPFTSVQSSSHYPHTQAGPSTRPRTHLAVLLEAREAQRAARTQAPTLPIYPAQHYAPSYVSPYASPVPRPSFSHMPSEPPTPRPSVILSMTYYSSRDGAPPVPPNYTRVNFDQQRPEIHAASRTLTLEQTRTVRTLFDIEADTCDNKGKARNSVVTAMSTALGVSEDRVRPHIPAGESQVSDLITAVLIAENLAVPNLLDMATLVERVLNALKEVREEGVKKEE